MRERAHVAGALHIVLAAQRVHADAGAADIASRHREVGDRDHRGRTLAVFGDPEPVVDRTIAAGREQSCRAADILGRHAGDLRDFLRTVARLGDERRPMLELAPVAALAHERLVHQPFGDDDMRQRRQDRDVACRAKAAGDTTPPHAACARGRCGADRSRSAWRPRATASSAARQTPDGRRSDWRRSR